jgi:hypothetical protein
MAFLHYIKRRDIIHLHKSTTWRQESLQEDIKNTIPYLNCQMQPFPTDLHVLPQVKKAKVVPLEVKEFQDIGHGRNVLADRCMALTPCYPIIISNSLPY